MTQEKPLGRYTILRELGRGAIGAVYEATDRTSGAVVALKVLDPALFADRNSQLAALFLKNARSAARLRHRNIVGVLDAGEAGGTAYVAMELVEGDSLRHLLDQRPLPLARAARIFDDIASALAYAHEEGMVHRGVKPSNIMVMRSGVAKIGDFGTGQIGDAALRYASPEQLRRDTVDHRSDQFSLGIVFYEMLTRRMPFDGKSPQQVKENILRAQPPQPPSKLNPQLPVALDAFVLRLLAARPDDRFADARILLRDLQRLGLRPGSTVEPSSVPPVRPAPVARMEPPAPPPPAPVARAQRPAPAPEPDPALPMPDAHQIPIRAPIQEHHRLARHDEPIEAFGVGIRPEPSAADDFPQRDPLADREAFDHRKAMLMMDREAERARAAASRPGILAPLALVLAMAAIGLTGYMYWSLGFVEQGTIASIVRATAASPAASPAPPALPPVAEAPKEPPAAVAPWQASAPQALPKEMPVAAQAVRPIAPPPVAKAIKEPAPVATPAPPPLATNDEPANPEPPGTLFGLKVPSKPAAAEPAPLPKTEPVIASAPEQPVPARAAPAKEQPRAKPPAAKPAAQQARGKAQLVLTVSPGGDVYINGERQGTTPEITTYDLDPGMHHIEVRSGSRKPFVTYMTVEAGEKRRIRHDFDAKPSRPPT